VSKYNRTEFEIYLLSILKELESDSRIVKKKHDRKSQRNKVMISNKINMVNSLIITEQFFRGYNSKNTTTKFNYPRTNQTRSLFNKIYNYALSLESYNHIK